MSMVRPQGSHKTRRRYRRAYRPHSRCRVRPRVASYARRKKKAMIIEPEIGTRASGTIFALLGVAGRAVPGSTTWFASCSYD